ncbi:MAG TPA: RNA methyltransferase [Acidimicrobiales bacterium]|nr:RNA methyltransferase [Acidimicrobiales bacterium]
MADTPKVPDGLPLGPLIEVNDRDDPRLDLYRDLNDPASRIRLEGNHPALVVEGRLAVDRLLASPYTVRSLLLDDHQLTSAGDLVTSTRARGAPVFVASRAVLASTVGFALHRGVVAIANRPSPTDPERLLADVAVQSDLGRTPRLLGVLEGLNDHENIGALFRNAAAFGVAGILLDPTCADPLYRRSIRVSVGHILHLPFARLVPWPNGLQQVRAAGFVVSGLVPQAATASQVPAVSLAELKARLSGSEPPAGVALLLGAEGPGLSDGAMAACDVLVSIPMAEPVDSLNVATAAAIAFHALAGP